MSQQGEAAEQIVNMATNVTVKGVECDQSCGKGRFVACHISHRRLERPKTHQRKGAHAGV